MSLYYFNYFCVNAFECPARLYIQILQCKLVACNILMTQKLVELCTCRRHFINNINYKTIPRSPVLACPYLWSVAFVSPYTWCHYCAILGGQAMQPWSSEVAMMFSPYSVASTLQNSLCHAENVLCWHSDANIQLLLLLYRVVCVALSWFPCTSWILFAFAHIFLTNCTFVMFAYAIS